MMEVSEKQWSIAGFVILLLTSSLIMFAGRMNVWVPMPVYLVILSWIVFVLYIFFTPGLYLLNLKLFSKSDNFSLITIVLVVMFAVLNAWYFSNSWEYGEKYQGLVHTKVVALENVIGFGVVLILAIGSHIKRYRSGTNLANLLLFFLLSWCAFPYLGETP